MSFTDYATFYNALEAAGHRLQRRANGEVDNTAYTVENHNGPACVLCGIAWCEHCYAGKKSYDPCSYWDQREASPDEPAQIVSAGLTACQCECCQQWRMKPRLTLGLPEPFVAFAPIPQPEPRITPERAEKIANEISRYVYEHTRVQVSGDPTVTRTYYLQHKLQPDEIKQIAAIIERAGNDESV